MRRTRLSIDFLIIGGLLVFGSLFAPKGSGYGGGFIRTLPLQEVKEAFFLSRGMRYFAEYSANIPLDFYIMDRTQYQAYIENHSTTALLAYKNTTTAVFDFKAKKSGQYYLIIERLEPPGKVVWLELGNQSESGLNANFLQPGIIFIVSGIGLAIISLFPKMKEKYFH